MHGLDINRHAVHLAASMLTLSAPSIDYEKMNIFNMLHGIDDKGKPRAGSLDILAGNAGYLPVFKPDIAQKRLSGHGYKTEELNLERKFDLVIMNPPYTRNKIRNRQLPATVRRRVQKHERDLVKLLNEDVMRDAIHNSSMGTFFGPIADILTNDRGSVAMVFPFAVCTGVAANGFRKLLTHPDRFHVELIVTSHDNRRIYFSENTNIHEALIVLRRPSRQNRGETAFVSLSDNPSNPAEARILSSAIRKALEGDRKALSSYGTISWRKHDRMHEGRWTAACFYDHSIADLYDDLATVPSLKGIDKLADVAPDGRAVRGAFVKSERRQSPDMRALWDNKAELQNTMKTTFDSYIVAAKKNTVASAGELWRKRGHLLLPARSRINLARTMAVFSDEPILGSAYVPVNPIGANKLQVCKAWCVWLNSTFGILAFLNIRQKNLTYPQFSIDGLRSILVPDLNKTECDTMRLVRAWDDFADKPLLTIPEIHIDEIRKQLDRAVLDAIPGLPGCEDVDIIRRAIAQEPSVNNRREYVPPVIIAGKLVGGRISILSWIETDLKAVL